MNRQQSTQAVLLYDASTGQAATGMLDSGGMFQELHEFAAGTFKSGWTHITETNGLLLLYDASTGQAATGMLDSGGMFQALHEFAAGTFKPVLTHITT